MFEITRVNCTTMVTVFFHRQIEDYLIVGFSLFFLFFFERTYSVDPDQTLQNVASDQGLHLLPLIQQFGIVEILEVKLKCKKKKKKKCENI